MCNELKKHHNFTFVLPKNNSNRRYVEQLGFNVFELNFIEISRDLRQNLAYLPVLLSNAFQLSKIVVNNNIDIIHCNNIYNLTPVLSKIFHNAIILTHIRRMPDSFPSFLYAFWKAIHKNFSTSLIAVSKANKKGFDDHHKVQVIYNALPFNEVHSDHLASEKTKNTILYLGNFIPGKGQDLALSSLIILKQKFPDLEFEITFVGSDMGLKSNNQYLLNLIELVKKTPILNGSVLFESFVEDVELKIKQHKICLNFSESESLSRVSMEALFYGTPLIATNVGGTCELFEHEKSGFLVKNRNVTEMADRIYELLTTPSLQSAFSFNSRQYVREKFSQQNTILKMHNHYLKFIND